MSTAESDRFKIREQALFYVRYDFGVTIKPNPHFNTEQINPYEFIDRNIRELVLTRRMAAKQILTFTDDQDLNDAIILLERINEQIRAILHI